MTSSEAVAMLRAAVVAGHGDFAAGMISAVQQVSGRGDAFRGVSNRDLGATALEEIMRAAVRATGARVIFTDLPAGSCTIAARRIARDVTGMVVVTGANLTMLLSWVLGTDDATACERALDRGRGAMNVLPGSVTVEGRSAH